MASTNHHFLRNNSTFFVAPHVRLKLILPIISPAFAVLAFAESGWPIPKTTMDEDQMNEGTKTQIIDSTKNNYAEALQPIPPYSHSIVPGGLLVMSYTTRLTPFTSLMMRVATWPMNFMSNG